MKRHRRYASPLRISVVCQSSEAAFHRSLSSGVVHARQTSPIGAAILVSTVILSVMTSLSLGLWGPVEDKAEVWPPIELLDVTEPIALRAHAFVLTVPDLDSSVGYFVNALGFQARMARRRSWQSLERVAGCHSDGRRRRTTLAARLRVWQSRERGTERLNEAIALTVPPLRKEHGIERPLSGRRHKITLA